MEIKLNEVDVQKLDLKEGDTLLITIKSDDVDQYTIETVKQSFKSVFPNNRVAILAVGTEGDIRYSVLSEKEVQGCGPSYCVDCSCGKKEQAEGQ
jgi:hypothetical protein